jgi:uncharacterized protein with FMN-binding domain
MRLLIALASTAAGLAALLSFKTHSAAGGAVAAQAAGTQGGSTSTSAAGGTGSAGTASTGTASSGSGKASSGSGKAASGSGKGSASSASRQGTASSAGTRTVTGAVENTQYGPMQVQVTLAGRKITGVKVLQETNMGSLSQQIDANAVPQLTKETLAAQSARIDAVSGASYTSSGYIQSLQSALDKANA